MPRLLIVTTVSTTLRAFLLPYANFFRQSGWRVDALSSQFDKSPECLQSFDACHEITFSRKPWDIRNFIGIGNQIRSLVIENDYDIVHVHTPVASFITRLALSKISKEKRPKIVYTAHGFHFYKGGGFLKNKFFAALEKFAAQWTDHLIVINKEDYNAAIEQAISTPDKLSLLPGIGLDIAHYQNIPIEPEKIKKIYNDMDLKQNDELFLMPAEFNRGKRHQDALKALAQTGKKNFHLAFAGAGPLLEPTKLLTQKLGLENQVHFLGHRSDLPLLMLASRAVVLPSEREGLNRSIMESISLGIPVLGADSRGIRDIITDPSRGALFPVGNTAKLGALMILAAADPNPVKPAPNPAWDISALLSAHKDIYTKLMA